MMSKSLFGGTIHPPLVFFSHDVMKMSKIIIHHPYIAKHIGYSFTKDETKEILSISHELYEFVDTKNEELQFQVISKCGYLIRFVESPSLEVCLAAVKQSGLALKYIKSPTEEVCRAALSQNPSADKYLPDKFKYLVIKKEPEQKKKKTGPSLSLKGVREQTPELCLSAVKENGLNLKYVFVQTEEICMAAILQNPRATVYLEKYFQDLIIDLIDQRPDYIWHVSKPTIEICEAIIMKGAPLHSIPAKMRTTKIILQSLKRDGLGLRDVTDQTLEMCQVAIDNDPYSIQFVKEQTPELCWQAIKKSPLSIKFITSPTEEMWKWAITENLHTIRYLPVATDSIRELLNELIKN